MQDYDIRALAEKVTTVLNVELATAPDIIALTTELQPHQATLVPEKREEVTTEGGLDVVGQAEALAPTITSLSEAGICVSLFIDPEENQIRAAVDSGAPFIELHTGRYAEAMTEDDRQRTYDELIAAADLALGEGLRVNAGHGLNYRNVQPIAAMDGIEELNIGHAIIARAVLVGLDQAVREMRDLILEVS